MTVASIGLFIFIMYQAFLVKRNTDRINMHIHSYVSYEDACSLMKNCKAFICPSYYEGFGDSPLEALALGTKIIVSNRSALPEVFGKAAHYIDLYNTDVDLDKLLKEPVADADTVLNKYSWEKSAKKL